jgi:hypothetical protein
MLGRRKFDHKAGINMIGAIIIALFIGVVVVAGYVVVDSQLYHPQYTGDETSNAQDDDPQDQEWSYGSLRLLGSYLSLLSGFIPILLIGAMILFGSLFLPFSGFRTTRIILGVICIIFVAVLYFIPTYFPVIYG